MRLWHKNLIPVLPRQQLIAQWRELCAIAGNIDIKGTPNHILVNKVCDYPQIHFVMYTNLVLNEMNKRGYKVSEKSYTKLVEHLNNSTSSFNTNWYKYVPVSDKAIYKEWHDLRYLRQCYYNLQEKYDCGGIPKDDWKRITEVVMNETNKMV